MRKKKAFTLLEVMVALSIFSVLSLMITAMLIQSQKILAKTDNSANTQNVVRTALLKIQNESKNYNEVVVTNKFGYFNENKWNVIEENTQSRELKRSASSSSARELLRFTNSENEIAKVYVEVNENNKHQLVEFNINKSTNEIVDNSKNVLIDNIIGEGVESISVTDKDNKLIILDCSSMITEEGVNKTNYVASFTKKIDNNTNLSIGSSDGNGVVGGENDKIDGTGGQSGNGSKEEESDEDGWYENWQKDGIEITINYNNGYNEGDWSININNNSNFDIFGWELLVKLDNGTIKSYYNGQIENLQNNIYKIYSKDFYQAEIKKGNSKWLSGKFDGQMTNNIKDITFRYKKVIQSDDKYLELENGVGVKLAMTNQWDGTAQWKIDIKNYSSKNINKWELIFEFEKPIKSVGWGLQFEDLGNGKYKIKNTEQNEIYSNNQKEITFESGSGILDRNLRNIEFNIIN